MVTIIDYGLGNVKAFVHIYKELNVPYRVVADPGSLQGSSKLILPGVGAFDYALSKLRKSGFVEELDRLVIQEKCPILGVCVGMQMLARSSEEGDSPGLGWIDAVVRKFDVSAFCSRTHLPHMGWNDVVASDAFLFSGIKNPRYYFLHSYYFDPADPSLAIASADYGTEFVCAVQRDNVLGVQFHPEKSHHWGVQLLKNFAEL